MRIESLEIVNLASLRGMHVVPFQTVTTHGLFGITGETGSGKSTLLNAITLALYGKVYKKNLNQNDLITLGEKEGSIKLIFLSKGKKYQAHWKCVIKRKNGELLTTPRTERFLYEEKDDQWMLLPDNVEEVLNLNFEQFTRCVVLNQGEFAKFLTSHFTERKEILEKLYSGSTIDQISEAVKRRMQITHDQTSKLEIELYSVTSQNTQSVDLLEEHLLRLNEKNKALEVNQKQIKETISLFESLVSLHLNHKIALKKKNENQFLVIEKTDSFNLTQTNLKQNDDLLKLKEESFAKEDSVLVVDIKKYQHLHQVKIDRDRNQSEINIVRSSLISKKNQLTHLNLRHKKHEDDLNTKKNLLTISAELLLPTTVEMSDWGRLDKVQFDLEKDLQHLENELLSFSKEEKELNLKQTQYQIQLDKIKTKLNLNTIDENSLQALMTQYQDQINSNKQTHIQLTKHRSDQKKLLEEASSHESSFQEFLVKMEENTSEFKKIKDELDQKNWILHLVAIKEHLKHHPQDDCPLCKNPLNINLNLTQWEKEKLTETHQNIQILEMKCQNLKDVQLISQQKLRQFQDEKELILNELSHIPKNLNDSIFELEKELFVLQQKLDTFLPLYNEAIKISELIKLTLAHMTSLKNSLGQRTENLNNKKIIKESSKTLIRAYTNKYPHLLDLDPAKILENMNLRGHIFSDQKMIEEIQLQQTQINQELQEFEAKITLVDKEIYKHNQFIQITGQELQLKYPQLSPELVRQSFLNEIKLLVHKNTLLLKELKDREGSLKEVQGRLLTIDEQLKELDLHFNQTLHQLNHLTPTLLIDQVPTIIEPLLDSYKNNLAQLEKQFQENNIQIGQYQTHLLESKKRIDLATHLEEKLKRQKNIQSKNQMLYDLVGKDELRNFILSLVESHLIQQTNHELELLCRSRYEIKQEKNSSRQSTDFYIVDKWRDGETRKISTLSGGETFMVSLAMALALAEMTRGQAEIEAFFIDEGFGTLDDESLEEVIQMLHTVESRGQQIGLISHMKSLTSRLPALINLNKDSRGNSTLELIYS